MSSHFDLPKNFAHKNDKDECEVNEACDHEFREDVITAEDGVNTVRSVARM